MRAAAGATFGTPASLCSLRTPDGQKVHHSRPIACVLSPCSGVQLGGGWKCTVAIVSFGPSVGTLMSWAHVDREELM